MSEVGGSHEYARHEGLVDEQHQPAARRAAARMLLSQAQRIDQMLEQSAGQVTSELLTGIGYARSWLSAIERPLYSFDRTCLDDGTPVGFDDARGSWCCSNRPPHCPPPSA
jgi:hypothetical protein